MAQQVGCDADLLGGEIHQLGHRAVPEQVRVDGFAERVLSAQRAIWRWTAPTLMGLPWRPSHR